MFTNLERTVQTFQIEAVSADYVYRATLHPLGELPIFLNDQRRNFLRLDQVELCPLAKDRQTKGLKREYMIVNRHKLLLVSLLMTEEAKRVKILDSKRQVIFYVGPFAVQGDLHVNVDANDEDLLDESRDFYPLTDAGVFPMQSLGDKPAQKVPLLFINRSLVQSYHSS